MLNKFTNTDFKVQYITYKIAITLVAPKLNSYIFPRIKYIDIYR